MTPSLLVVGQGPAGLSVASLLHDVMSVSVVANGASSLPLWSGCWDFGSRLRTGGATREPLQAWAEKPVAHPGRTLTPREWETLWRTFQSLWRQAGVPTSTTGRNRYVLSARGTLRLTYAVPDWLYVTDRPTPLTLVAVPGLPDTDMHYVAASYQATTGIEPRVISLPPPPISLDSLLRWAAWLDEEAGRHWLMATLPTTGLEVRDDTLVFPGLLGIRHTEDLLADLESQRGIRVREMTAVPPSVSGLRFQSRWRSWLIREGVRFIPATVSRIYEGEARLGDGNALAFDAAVIATGGVLGGGLSRQADGTLWDTARGEREAVGDPLHDFSSGVRAADPYGGLADRVWVAGRQRGLCDPDREQDGGGTVLASAYETAWAIRRALHLSEPKDAPWASGKDGNLC